MQTSTITASVPSAIHPHTMITIESIQPGMVLAQSVYDAADRLLVTAGTPLTPRHQRQMRQRGVTLVAVAVKDATLACAATTLESSAAAVELVERVQNDPFMRELVLLARLRHERRRLLAAPAPEERR